MAVALATRGVTTGNSPTTLPSQQLVELPAACNQPRLVEDQFSGVDGHRGLKTVVKAVVDVLLFG